MRSANWHRHHPIRLYPPLHPRLWPRPKPPAARSQARRPGLVPSGSRSLARRPAWPRGVRSACCEQSKRDVGPLGGRATPLFASAGAPLGARRPRAKSPSPVAAGGLPNTPGRWRRNSTCGRGGNRGMGIRVDMCGWWITDQVEAGRHMRLVDQGPCGYRSTCAVGGPGNVRTQVGSPGPRPADPGPPGLKRSQGDWPTGVPGG